MDVLNSSVRTVCTRCGKVSWLEYNLNLTCKYCGGEIINTHKYSRDWDKEFEEATGITKGYTGKEVNEYIRQVVKEDSNHEIYNHEASEYELREAIENQELLKKQASMNILRCPKCYSTNVGRQKRGFKLGRAVAGAALTGFLDVGAAAGAVGSNKMVNVCLNCGHTWK